MEEFLTKHIKVFLSILFYIGGLQVVYYIDLSDKRCEVVKGLLQRKYNVGEYDWKTKGENGDCYVFSPAKKLTDKEILSLPDEITLYSGKIEDRFIDILKQKRIKHCNFMTDEVFAIKNAMLTAEGVLPLIIENTPRSIYQNNLLILGGGRIALSLAVLFGKLGLNFSVANFNPIKFPSTNIYTKNTYFKYSFLKDIKNFDVIINTIPATIITDNVANKINRDTLFIETASVNCLDKSMATHFKYLLAPALPSKFSIESAGKLMYESIMGENKYV